MGSETYSLEITMNQTLAMHVDQPPSDVHKLQRSGHHQQQVEIGTSNEKHTSPNRFASGSAFTKSLMLPLTIHSDTITNFSDMVTPNSGSTFG